MIFKHLVLNMYENNDNKDYFNPIILLDENEDDPNSNIIAQAISLDIRGDFGLFINNLNNFPIANYKWTGNLFNIVINTNDQIVEISDFTDEENKNYDEENKKYIFNLYEWNEALLDWKQFYLKTLGFLEFKSKALCHMMGVLILTYDQMSNEIFSSEMITESIKKCAERYGVNKSVIYRDCRKVTGLYNISDFCLWAKELLLNNISSYKLCDFAFYNIDKHNGDFKMAIKKYLNIDLYC